MKNFISNDEIIIWIENMQVIGKASVRIDSFSTSKVNLEVINELYKDDHTNILIDRFELFYDSTKDISNEDIEVLNKIKPKILKIDKISWTLNNIKALTLLNCAEIRFNFNKNYLLLITLSFSNTPVQLFDSESGERQRFEWESIVIETDQNKFKSGVLFKSDTIDYLFIPLEAIVKITYSGLKAYSSAHDINKQFANLKPQQYFNSSGLIVPLECMTKVFFQVNHETIELFESN